jgi:hypothetical protein
LCLKEQADSGRKKNPKPDTNATEESDRSIIPAKVANKANAVELLERRGQTKENT